MLAISLSKISGNKMLLSFATHVLDILIGAHQ